VVKAANDPWDRDNANQDEWSGLVGRQLLRRSADGKQQRRDYDDRAGNNFIFVSS
jgi:hypothetical protein